ncbi:MAG: 16S rRNA (cytosine(1402)-N(4))-methyltransferase RsmH [Desulfuromonadales bacterium]|nr:16S rRNA (cytosine(1402)-N(4))-methyltransferase RsmH [Desulfuromonadales bacterium]
MASNEFRHVSVMADEVLRFLDPHRGGTYLDGTLGGAGHARLILEATSPDGVLVGMDRDAEALAAAKNNLAAFGDRAILRQGNFSEMNTHLDLLEIDQLDGILLDLGVSSHQLDSPERGFSFREDGPLDMRMNPAAGVSAATVVAEAEADELRRIFRDYGEERWAGKIARAIVADRDQTPFVTTLQLAELVCRVVPGGRVPQRIHPATRIFQALRIYVNGELESLRSGLDVAWQRLKVGGRLVVISFHSLEDRIVKQTFRALAAGCNCPPRLAVCACGHQPKVRILTRKAVRATEDEIKINPRSRSAVLRAIEKLPEEDNQDV